MGWKSENRLFWDLIPNFPIHSEHFTFLDFDSSLGQKTITLKIGLKINGGPRGAEDTALSKTVGSRWGLKNDLGALAGEVLLQSRPIPNRGSL